MSGRLENPKKAWQLLQGLKAGRLRREKRLYQLSRHICPWRGRLAWQKGRDPHETGGPDGDTELFTGIAADAVLRGASGMTSGMTPRNISWFKPSFTDPAMMELSGAREWCDELDRRMKTALAEGGFYQAIQDFNLDLLWSGAGLLYSETGGDSLMRFYCIQPGAYLVQTDTAGRLEAVAREISMSATEAANRFGEASLSEKSRRLLSARPWESVTIWHIVCPLARPSGVFSVESVYLEDGAKGFFLQKGGFHEMPYFFTTWNEGATPYGVGPGDNALADAMQMDILERRKLAGLAKLVDPPMLCPSSLKDYVDLSPGAVNMYDGQNIIRPIIDLGPYASSLSGIQNEIATVAARLEKGLMASVFSSMPLDQRPAGMSATEFLERKRDALQQLGPIMSAYEPRVLMPLLFRVANALDREGFAPQVPESLAGSQLFMKMDFISPMANALRQNGVETTRALWQDVASLVQATGRAELLDKLDLEQIIDELATGLGAPGSVIRSDEDVARIREQRQREEEQTAQARILQQAASALGQAAEQPGHA